MVSLFVVMMLLSMLSLSSVLKGFRANSTSWLMKAASETVDKKGGLESRKNLEQEKFKYISY